MLWTGWIIGSEKSPSNLRNKQQHAIEKRIDSCLVDWSTNIDRSLIAWLDGTVVGSEVDRWRCVTSSSRKLAKCIQLTANSQTPIISSVNFTAALINFLLILVELYLTSWQWDPLASHCPYYPFIACGRG